MIITSLLDTDLYKITMWQAMLHHHPGATARYEFICRNPYVFDLKSLVPSLEIEISQLCQLQFKEEELDFLSKIPYLKDDFINFLRIFKLQSKFVQIISTGNSLKLILEGPQVHISIFEIYLLAIISELYSKKVGTPKDHTVGKDRLMNKIKTLQNNLKEKKDYQFPFEFYDFGTRRRYSKQWQQTIVASLARELPVYFKGTSNLYFAKKYNLRPIGTLAHEYFQSHQAYGGRLRDFQKSAMEEWVQEYRGDLGIALTDTITIDAFLKDFDLYFAKLFDGLRHDSGDPIAWGNKCIEHYKTLQVDPSTKRLVFSDALTLDRAFEIYQYFGNRIQCGFGVGTNLSNDTGVPPLSIVIKNTLCNGQPTAKISDDPEKTLCTDESFINYLRSVFNVPAKK